MKPKRLISLLVAVCMMITMLPLSAVTAFAASASSYPTPTSPDDLVASDGTYWYAYKENADDTATITDFLGPVNSTKTPAPYTITVPTELDGRKVTGLGESSFSGIYSSDHPKNYNLRSFCNQIQSVTIPESDHSGRYQGDRLQVLHKSSYDRIHFRYDCACKQATADRRCTGNRR